MLFRFGRQDSIVEKRYDMESSEFTHDKQARHTPLLLRDADVAALLQVEPSAVQYLHRVGRLRAVKVGKELRWKPSAVSTFVDELQPDT